MTFDNTVDKWWKLDGDIKGLIIEFNVTFPFTRITGVDVLSNHNKQKFCLVLIDAIVY